MDTTLHGKKALQPSILSIIYYEVEKGERTGKGVERATQQAMGDRERERKLINCLANSFALRVAVSRCSQAGWLAGWLSDLDYLVCRYETRSMSADCTTQQYLAIQQHPDQISRRHVCLKKERQIQVYNREKIWVQQVKPSESNVGNQSGGVCEQRLSDKKRKNVCWQMIRRFKKYCNLQVTRVFNLYCWAANKKTWQRDFLNYALEQLR